MLPIDPADPLFNAVIETLSRHPDTTVADLHKKLAQQKVRITLQHLYRVIGKMVEGQVVLKRKRSLSLNLLWLSYIELFAQGAREKLQQGRDLSALADLRDGGRITFPVYSLHDVQAQWHHLLIQVNKLLPPSPDHVLHKYYSHAYWLLRPDADIAFYERIAKHIRCLWLIGSESFPDLLAQKTYAKIFSIAVTDRPPFPDEGYLLNILGDYVIDCVMPVTVAGHFSLFFRNVKTARDWKPELLESLFHLEGAFTISVSRSRRRADELRGKIEHLMPKQFLTR